MPAPAGKGDEADAAPVGVEAPASGLPDAKVPAKKARTSLFTRQARGCTAEEHFKTHIFERVWCANQATIFPPPHTAFYETTSTLGIPTQGEELP